MYLPVDEKNDGTVKEEKEYAIRVSIQDKTEITRTLKTINTCIEFNEFKNLQINTNRNDVSDVPDIFIYLVEKKVKKIYASKEYKQKNFI